jgi:ACT domain-containing protein
MKENLNNLLLKMKQLDFVEKVEIIGSGA